MKEVTAIIKSLFLFLYARKSQFLILISYWLFKQNSEQEKHEKKFSD